MKRTVVITVVLALFVLSYSPAHAGLSVVSVDGQIAPDTITFGAPIRINILWDGSEFPGCVVTGSENGYRLYSPTGTPFTASGEWNSLVPWDTMYDAGVFVSQNTGGGEDSLQFGGFRLFKDGIPEGFYDVAHIITLEPFPLSTVGGEICIDSTSCPP